LLPEFIMRLLAAILLVPVFAAAQAPVAPAPFPERALATATQLRDGALQGSGAYAIVESLTTEVGARMAGTAADARAVRWAEARFKALGFDRVTLEPVTFPVWRRGVERAEVLSPAPQQLSLLALGFSSGTPKGGVEAEVVRFATLDELKAAPEAAVRGKIVFVSQKMERRRDGGGYGKIVAVRGQGAEFAGRKGAAAVLIRSIGTDSDRFPHTGGGVYMSQVALDPEMRKRARTLSDGSLVVETLVPAAALSNPDADQLDRLVALGQPVKLRLVLDVGLAGEYTSHNVVGDLIGREQPDEIVAIGGHLDSWDPGTGAIDDGAGVAITMAAGAAIAKLPERPRRTVRVIAWANEEQGLYGAQAYAKAHSDAAQTHVAVAESDFGAGRIYRFDSNVDAASLPVADAIGAVLYPLDIERGGNAARGGPDVGPLARLGVPVFSLGQDGSDYFDYHHTANDTLDKIDPAALDQNVAAYAAFAYLAAESEHKIAAPKQP
jgi:carboxypeptidase Q